MEFVFFESFAQAAEHEEESQKNGSKEDVFVAMNKEMEDYLSLNLQNRAANPLDWWKDHAIQFSHLSKLAKKFLATPASPVYSERPFSEYGKASKASAYNGRKTPVSTP